MWSKRLFFIQIFCFFLTIVFAQPVVNVVPTNATCIGNGKLTINTTNTTGNVLYALIAPSPITTPAQSSNIFEGLSAGTYTVAVYDDVASVTPVTATAQIKSTYVEMIIKSVTTSQSTEVCYESGNLMLNVQYGTTPYTYRIISAPAEFTGTDSFTSNSTYGSFTRLVSGNYTVSVTDACGTTKQADIRVSSNGAPMKNVTLGSATIGNSTVSSVTNSCDRLRVNIYNVSLKDENDQTSAVSYSLFQYRVEYPAYSGQFSAWSTPNYLYLSNFDHRVSLNYRVQVAAPCTGDTVFATPVFTIPYKTDYELYSGGTYTTYCDPPTSTIRVYNASTTECSPVEIQVYDSITNNMLADTIWTNLYYSFTINGNFESSKTYKLVIMNSQDTITKYMTMTSFSPPSAGIYSYDNYSTPNGSSRSCDFNTFRLTGSQINKDAPVTYSIASGPATRVPVTYQKNGGTLWDDLPYGTYQIERDYGCRKDTYTVSSTQKYIGYQAQPMTYEGTSFCGNYNIIVKGNYINMNGTVNTSVSSYAFVISGPAGTNTSYNISASSGGRISNLPAGRYVIGFNATNNSYSGNCYLVTDTITLPPYAAPIIDIYNSGGVTCENGSGSLYVTSTGVAPLTYRYKVKNSSDATYSTYQSGNSFPNLTNGEYTVQVKDACGTVVTQDLTMYNGSTQFLSMSATEGETCEGNSIEMKALPVGPVTSYAWLKDGVAISGEISDTFLIPSATVADGGIYTLQITNPTCILSNSRKLFVAPHQTTWTGNSSTSEWKDAGNWDNGIPGNCTYATIPGGINIYPELTVADSAHCDTLEFMPGAEVAKTHLLQYNKAIVSLKVASNRWYMVSPPLRDMYSGDYILSEKRLNPSVFMMQYQSNNPETGFEKEAGKWSNPFNTLDIPLNTSMGYVIWVDNDNSPDNTFAFPQMATQYTYYNSGGNPYATTGTLSRTHAGKFIYENESPVNGQFSVDIANSDSTNYPTLIAGNPYMSHLDFYEFWNQNQVYINNNYYIWTGSVFDATQHTAENLTSTSTSADGRYIAPMQSFIVTKTSDFNAPLTFTPVMSVTDPTSPVQLRQDKKKNALNLQLYRDDVRQSGIIVGVRDGASKRYKNNEDVWTLFSESDKKTAVMYSVIDGGAASINIMDNFAYPVELGIRTTATGKLKLRAENLDNFDNDVEIYLEDELLKRIHDFRRNPVYEFNNTTGNVTGRLYLRIYGNFTGTDEVTGGLQITKAGDKVYIYSSSGDLIRKVSLYNVQGQPLLIQSGIDNINTTVDIPQYNKQVIILKVQTDKQTETRKISVD